MKASVTVKKEYDLNDIAWEISSFSNKELEDFLILLDEYVEDPNFSKIIANRFRQIVDDRRIYG